MIIDSGPNPTEKVEINRSLCLCMSSMPKYHNLVFWVSSLPAFMLCSCPLNDMRGFGTTGWIVVISRLCFHPLGETEAGCYQIFGEWNAVFWMEVVIYELKRIHCSVIFSLSRWLFFFWQDNRVIAFNWFDSWLQLMFKSVHEVHQCIGGNLLSIVQGDVSYWSCGAD